MADPQSAPAPLHIPAILQNPVNASLRQVEAHNAQQREKALARREARAAGPTVSGGGRGKRVTRRQENGASFPCSLSHQHLADGNPATFAANPHIVPPRRSDFFPPVPLHQRPLRPTFPATVLPRSEHMPSASTSRADPLSASSTKGAFGTSLKGVRQLLRKRGRRAEHLVGVIEGQIRAWLGGDWELRRELAAIPAWKAIDPPNLSFPLMAGVPQADSEESHASPHPSQLPSHRSPGPPLPPLPLLADSDPAYILESTRSPAHLSWHVPDSFDRLVTHLVARYYELISWSADQPATDGSRIRMTHIVVPAIVKPVLPTSGRGRDRAVGLLTPETTDLSGQSASELDERSSLASFGSDSESGLSMSETATEIGESDLEGYSLDDAEGNTTITAHRDLVDELGGVEIDEIPLVRTISNGSSVYASSEGGSDVSGLGDSLMFDPPPQTGPGVGAWESSLNGVAIKPTFPTTKFTKVRSLETWEDRPTFFEYLYGE